MSNADHAAGKVIPYFSVRGRVSAALKGAAADVIMRIKVRTKELTRKPNFGTLKKLTK